LLLVAGVVGEAASSGLAILKCSVGLVFLPSLAALILQARPVLACIYSFYGQSMSFPLDYFSACTFYLFSVSLPMQRDLGGLWGAFDASKLAWEHLHACPGSPLVSLWTYPAPQT